MRAPSGDSLPARGAAKVTQMVVLSNPNKVGRPQESPERDPNAFLRKTRFATVSGILLLLLQVNLKMRVRLSYSRQGAAFQDTIQVDSFPGLGH